jgi:DNA-binding LacI/PurR family transcriptional regulator
VAEPTRPPVMGDVARLAGVSHQTVSRVLNAHAHIRPETRERVERAIEQLGYRPNGAARALVRGRSGVVGVITTSGALYGPRSAEHAVREAARAAGFAVASVDLTAVDRERLRTAIDDLQRIGVEGVVVVAGHDAAVDLARERHRNLPLVVVEGDLSRTAMSVGVDQAAGAAAAVQHLLSLGHRRVAHVAGPADWAEARARAQGWRSALAGAGLPAPAPLVGDWTAASGHAAGRSIASEAGVTAVFAGNDSMAVGVVHALRERGLAVPEDVSVVGFDDIPEAPYLSPSLTTVRQNFDQVGTRAVQLLSAALRGESPPSVPLVSPELVVRGSTAPVPVARADGGHP